MQIQEYQVCKGSRDIFIHISSWLWLHEYLININLIVLIVQGEDHPGFSHRGAEDRDEGAEGAGQEGVTSTFIFHPK